MAICFKVLNRDGVVCVYGSEPNRSIEEIQSYYDEIAPGYKVVQIDEEERNNEIKKRVKPGNLIFGYTEEEIALKQSKGTIRKLK